MAQESAGPGFGARLLIIFFALGIVALGLHPIRRDIRGFAHDAQAFLKRTVPTLSSLGEDSGLPPARRSSALNDSDQVPTINPAKRSGAPSGVEMDHEAEKKPQLDKLSPHDRKQLSDLVNGF